MNYPCVCVCVCERESAWVQLCGCRILNALLSLKPGEHSQEVWAGTSHTLIIRQNQRRGCSRTRKLERLFELISLVPQTVKNLPAMQETSVVSMGKEDPLEKEMATHSSILAWGIPWTEEPGGLQSTELQSWTQLSN